MMKIIILVGAGSFVGGVLRYWLCQAPQVKAFTQFPLGTLIVNLIGCFVIGLLFGWSEKINVPLEWRLFLATGLCGGFTTFSAFSMESLSLLRHGHYGLMLVYVLSNVLGGILLTILGYWVASLFR
jgi:CrcB protein